MKLIHKFWLLAFATFSLLSACSSKVDNNSSVEWEWVKTYGSIAGLTWTPESTNSTRSITLSDEYITFYENGLEVEQYDYLLFESDTILGDDISYQFIQYNQNTRWYDENGENLIIRDLCTDCYDDHYKKK